MALVYHGPNQALFGGAQVAFGPVSASLASLVITYQQNGTLTATAPSYTIRDASENRALTVRSGRRERPHRTRTAGDGQSNPGTLDVTAHINEGSFAASITAAYAVINAAERSTSVSTHRGTDLVRGITAYELRANAFGVDVRLTFRVVRPYTP